jgi:hypothetical protein
VSLYVFNHWVRGLDGFTQLVAGHAEFLGPIRQLVILVWVDTLVVLPAGLL